MGSLSLGPVSETLFSPDPEVIGSHYPLGPVSETDSLTRTQRIMGSHYPLGPVSETDLLTREDNGVNLWVL